MPLLLVAASGLDLVSGQFGQPTTLGFAVLTAGLALASVDPIQSIKVLPTRQKLTRRIRGRSVVAEAILADRGRNGDHGLPVTD
jgi:hypothetical protein